MKQAAKLLIIDHEDNYLLLYRSAHPRFGNDPDLPGGTLETGERLEDTVIREVEEEVGAKVDKGDLKKLYQGLEYSTHFTEYSLFTATLSYRPDVTLSWEHAAYEWLPREEFLKKIKKANDTFMQMVYDKIT